MSELGLGPHNHLRNSRHKVPLLVISPVYVIVRSFLAPQTFDSPLLPRYLRKLYVTSRPYNYPKSGRVRTRLHDGVTEGNSWDAVREFPLATTLCQQAALRVYIRL